MSKPSIADVFKKEKEFRLFEEDTGWVLSRDMVGLELEYEGLTLPPSELFKNSSRWTVTDDGSLRIIDGLPAAEFIFSAPLCGKDLTLALVELQDALTKLPKPPMLSKRTSTHVHLDVRNLNLDQLLYFLITYIIIEKVLFNWVGNDRETSNFCLPFYHAEGEIFEQFNKETFSHPASLIQLSHHTNKRYNALNITALNKYGSLEFRHLPGTIDIPKIKTWINLILRLKQWAMEAPLKVEILPDLFLGEKWEDTFKVIFKEQYPILMYTGMQRDLWLGARQAYDVLHSSTLQDITNTIKQEYGEHSIALMNFAEKRKIILPPKPEIEKPNNKLGFPNQIWANAANACGTNNPLIVAEYLKINGFKPNKSKVNLKPKKVQVEDLSLPEPASYDGLNEPSNTLIDLTPENH